MNWYLTVLRNYAVFSGRARRKEYWMFALFNIIFFIVAMIIDNILGTKFEMNGMPLHYGYVYTLYGLAVLIPGLAVLVRRLHDIGKSGWFALGFFISIIILYVILFAIKRFGNPILILFPAIAIFALAIWILVLVCTDSEMGENQYGLNPKEGTPSSGTSGALDSDIKI
jgi:uncharacterized membrane protein YhaH (DUF805 family)